MCLPALTILLTTWYPCSMLLGILLLVNGKCIFSNNNNCALMAQIIFELLKLAELRADPKLG